jgi:hypothetical protein
MWRRTRKADDYRFEQGTEDAPAPADTGSANCSATSKRKMRWRRHWWKQ